MLLNHPLPIFTTHFSTEDIYSHHILMQWRLHYKKPAVPVSYQSSSVKIIDINHIRREKQNITPLNWAIIFNFLSITSLKVLYINVQYNTNAWDMICWHSCYMVTIKWWAVPVKLFIINYHETKGPFLLTWVSVTYHGCLHLDSKRARTCRPANVVSVMK